jgi:hypothetical protein
MKAKGGLCGLVVWAGCTSGTAKVPAVPAVEPLACSSTISLLGTTSDPPTSVGPLALDTNGIDLCVHLDPHGFTRVHLAIDSPPEPGMASSVASRLEDATFAPILDGWDVTVGTTVPQTSMNLEWDPPAGTTTDVVVWLRGTSASVSTTLQMSLFDPLD